MISSTAEREGSDVFTTIDHTIQANAEAVLRQTIAHWGAKGATAVVRPTHRRGARDGSGARLRREQVERRPLRGAAEPRRYRHVRAGFDVQARHDRRSALRWARRAGHDVQAALLDPCRRPRRPRCRAARDQTLSVAQILSHSSNVGAVTIAEKLGSTELADWIAKFGFGKTTGLDFPGESPGQVLPLDRWSGSTIGNVPIGQGIAVTPLQMAAAYAAIANGGVWVEPHLVDRVGGRIVRHRAHRRIVSRAIDVQLKAMLTNVVDEHGATGNEAQIAGYTVAGKTGTAQKPGPNGYTTGKYVASFVGMVPVSKPRLVVLVTVDEPHGSIFGGEVAAPAFAQIAKFDLQYLEVQPDAPLTPSQ